MDGDGRGRHAHDAERSLGTQAVDDGLPVLVRADGGEQKVEGAGKLFQRTVVAGVDEVVRAEPARLFLFVGGGGEGCDLRAEGPGELQAEVAKSADAYDADTRGGAHAEVAQGRVDGDAGAEQRSDVLALERIGNRDGKARVDADGVGVAAVAADAGGLRGGTEVLVAPPA